jgi:hypothetical protein
MPCRICGDPKTVKSHLLPRAFVADARDGRTDLMVGSLDRQGFGLTQGGHFDRNLLCDIHERALGVFDDYAVDLVRSFYRRIETRELEGRSFWFLRQIDTGRLVRFAASVVWRWSESTLPETAGVALGEQEPAFRRAVFEGEDVSLEPVLVMYSLASRDLEPTTVRRIILAPSASKIGDVRFWGFAVGGLAFLVKADKRAAPSEGLVKANGRSDYVGEARFIEDGPEWPAIARMILNMRQARGKPPSVTT